MKNVTGYDLSKLLAGSWGTLAVLDEVSVKVLPAPDQTRTLLLLRPRRRGGGDGDVRRHGQPARRLRRRPSRRAGRRLRIEGVAPSVEARLKALRELLADRAPRMEELGTLESRIFWREVRDVAPLKAAPDAVVWKISCPPTEGPAIVARIKAQRPAAEAFYDWSGGLVWLALPASADADHAIVRGAIGASGRPRDADSRARGRARGRAGLPAAAAGARRAGVAREGELRSQAPLQSRGGWARPMQTNFTLAQLADPETARSDAHPAQVRALRLLHGDLPDLRAAGRRARQPARAHLSHQGDARGRSRADGARKCATSIAACRASPA